MVNLRQTHSGLGYTGVTLNIPATLRARASRLKPWTSKEIITVFIVPENLLTLNTPHHDVMECIAKKSVFLYDYHRIFPIH